MNRSAGYTLIEVLIMLAVTAILAATVLETVRASASNGLRIEQAARNASQDYITLAGVRRAVEATKPDYFDEPYTFTGTDAAFSALTSQPLISMRPGVHPFTLRIENTSEGAALVYEERPSALQVAFWPRAEGRFVYFGESNADRTGFTRRMGEPVPRNWSPSWPPPSDASQSASSSSRSYFAPQPLAVQTEIRLPDGRTQIIAFHLSTTAGPTPRVEDLLGRLQ